LANHDAYIERNRRNRPSQRIRNANIVLDYLLTHSCVRCGECDPVVLEFNHLDVRGKTGNVAELVRSGCSRQRLLDEIMKCEVLCANCHQRYTSSSRTAHYRRPTGSILNPRVPNFRVAANARNHALVMQFLANAACVDCAEKDSLVLQFDHMYDKLDHVAWLAGSGCSPIRLQAELLKCNVRCANCHRRRTAQAGNWFRARHERSLRVAEADSRGPLAALSRAVRSSSR